MTRKLMTRDELTDWLTAEIQKVPDCEETVLSVQYPLKEPDATGCNWSNVVIRVGPNITADQVRPAVDHLVERARAMFNLSE